MPYVSFLFYYIANMYHFFEKNVQMHDYKTYVHNHERLQLILSIGSHYDLYADLFYPILSLFAFALHLLFESRQEYVKILNDLHYYITNLPTPTVLWISNVAELENPLSESHLLKFLLFPKQNRKNS